MTGDDAGIIRAVTHWLCAGAGLGAVILTIQGMVRLRIDGYPHCTACHYNLHGLPEATAQCPECGAGIRRPGRIRHGTYARSKKRVAIGLLLAIAAVSGWYGAEEWAHSIQRRRPDLQQAIIRNDAKAVARIAALEPGLLNEEYTHDAIHDAARNGNFAVLLQLSELGVSLAKIPPGSFGDSLVIGAVESGNGEVLDLLIASGCDVNAAGSRRMVPLHIAVERGNTAAVLKLLAAHARTDVEDREWRTPLHEAVDEMPRPAAAEALLKHGVLVDVRNRQGQTPLHLAMYRNNYDVAWLLICHGADLSAHDSAGRTPAQLSEREGEYSIAGEIWARVLIESLRAGRKEHARALLRNDPWALRPGSPACSPVADWVLISSARSGIGNVTWQERAAVLKLLFEEGVSPNQENARGSTLLHRAANEDRMEIYRFLLEQGADPQIRDAKGTAPWAASVYDWHRYHAATTQYAVPRGRTGGQ